MAPVVGDAYSPERLSRTVRNVRVAKKERNGRRAEDALPRVADSREWGRSLGKRVWNRLALAGGRVRGDGGGQTRFYFGPEKDRFNSSTACRRSVSSRGHYSARRASAATPIGMSACGHWSVRGERSASPAVRVGLRSLVGTPGAGTGRKAVTPPVVAGTVARRRRYEAVRRRRCERPSSSSSSI